MATATLGRLRNNEAGNFCPGPFAKSALIAIHANRRAKRHAPIVVCEPKFLAALIASHKKDSPLTVLGLFTAHRILQSTDRVLHFAGSLVGLAIGFQLLIAKNPPGGLFHRSLGLLCRASDSIFVHCHILVIYLFGV